MRLSRWGLAVLCAVSLVACSDDTNTAGCVGGRREVVVLAASSLSTGFDDLQSEVSSGAKCVDEVVFQYGSSGTLAAQIANGSPADIFVSAGQDATQVVHDALANLEPASDYVKNTGALMLNADSADADKVVNFADLFPVNETRVLNLKIGVCVATAPCGAMADEIMSNLTRPWMIEGDRLSIGTTEATSVSDLVTKISIGELDGGIVYESDCARRAASTRCVPIPDDINVVTSYSISSLNNDTATQEVFTRITSDEVRSALVSRFGFMR